MFKRSVLIGGVVAGIGYLSYLARPARIHDARVRFVAAGGLPEARVTLTYGTGARPLSVIIDVITSNGLLGSATIDGEISDVSIPLPEALNSEYTLSLTATYRLLGRPLTIKYTF